MKNSSYIYKYVCMAVAIVFGLLPAMAQQPAEDALYIYRNDGGFNGFFYSDIQEITFSRIDLNGIEQDDYAVQEVYTADSVYRIPIAAIDSVSFVTPQTVYKEGVITPSSNLWDYVISSDEATQFTLSSSIPSALVPRVGNKLANTSATPHLPHGFYGKVSSVSTVAGGILITCEKADLTELFDRYVTKVSAEGVSVESGARRRASNESGGLDIDLPEFEKHIDLSGYSYGLNDDFSIAGEGTLDFRFSPKLSVRAFLSVSWWDGINFDLTARLEATTQYDMKMKASVGGQFDIPAGAVKIPLGTSPIMLEMETGLTTSMTGEVELEQHWKNKSSGYSVFQYNSLSEGNSQALISFHNMENTWNSKMTGKLTTTGGIYTELNFSLGDVRVARAGARFESGFKTELDAQIKMSDLEEPKQYAVTSLYDALNRDGGFKMGPYGTGKLIFSAGSFSKEITVYDQYKEGTAISGEFQGGLVPQFSSLETVYDESKDLTTITTTLTRNVLVSGNVGFAIYDKSGKFVTQQWYWREYWKQDTWSNLSMEFEGLETGWYRAYPIFKLFGKELLASPPVDFYVGDQVAGLVMAGTKKQSVTHTPANEYVPLYTTKEGQQYEFMSAPLEVPYTDLLELFYQNMSIDVDSKGNFKIEEEGLALSGSFADFQAGTKPERATGSYTISTSYFDKVKTEEEVAAMYRSGVSANILAVSNPMLEGTISHSLSGTFTLEWSASDNAYVLTLSDEGTYELDCTCYNGVSNIDTDNTFGAHPNATVTSTKEVHLSGTADVDFQILYNYVEK